MSLIVYDNGLLLADRLSITNIHGMPYKGQMQKLHVHPTKYFAFAYSGETLMKRYHQELLTAIITGIAYWQLTDQKQKLRFSPGQEPLFADRAFIIMTRNNVWYRLGSDTEGFVEIELDEWTASGTFMAAWRVARTFGLPAIEAAKKAIEFVEGETPTIDSFKRTSLVPFPSAKRITSMVKKKTTGEDVPPQLKEKLAK